MTLKQISSVITTSPKAQSSKTSTEATATGVTTSLSGEQKEKAVARLLEIGKPNVVDTNLLCSVESILGCQVIPKETVRYPKDGDVDIRLNGYTISCDNILSVERAMGAVAASLVPLPVDDIISQLKMLAALVVKPSGENADDYSVRIQAIAMQLSEYPADIVVRAIKETSETTTFWPSYAEIYAKIKWRMKKRELLMVALERKRVELTA